MVPDSTSTSVVPSAGTSRPRLSVIVEWANTEWNGVPRAFTMLSILAEQWRSLVAGRHPPTLAADRTAFLQSFAGRAELIPVSAQPLTAAAVAEVHRHADAFEVRPVCGEGLEYYALKNHGAAEATGDFLIFVDSDVYPDDGWLAQLLGSFADSAVDVVCGQTYVAPTDLVARAFALGWTYPLRSDGREMFRAKKFYANTIAFRTPVFRRTGFRKLGRRTRGASSLLGEDLARLGISVWQNSAAGVAHPPPADWHHLAVRALAHGRDHYMRRSEERSWSGLGRSLAVPAFRNGRALFETTRSWRRVGLKAWEVPAALAICSAYYGLFALGGILTHVSPEAMGRRFRI